MKPLVTIITPAYNCEKYIEETMKSVLENGYDNIEYFVINDGSKDRTFEVMVDYYKNNLQYDEILGLSSHDNMGEHETINKGLRMVKGKYFMMVNADDPLLPGAIEKLVAFMELNPDVLCGYPDWKVIGENGEDKIHRITREYDFTWMIRHHTCIPSVGSMFKSTLLETIGYRTNKYKYLGDFDYWLRVAMAGKMARLPEELACWRHNDGQLSGDKSDSRAREHIQIIEDLYFHNLPKEIMEVENEAKCWSHLVAAYVTDSKLKAVNYTLLALAYFPKILLTPDFWDTSIRRAYFILRRWNCEYPTKHSKLVSCWFWNANINYHNTNNLSNYKKLE